MAHLDTRETQQATRRFIKQAMKLPMLEPEHEQILARKWKDQQDESALHELTSAHLRLVVSIASKFVNYGLPMSDLVQEGNIGLMQAAARFEPDREVRFQPMRAGGSFVNPGLCAAQLVDCAHRYNGRAKIPVFQHAPSARQN